MVELIMEIVSVHAESIRSMLQQIKRTNLGCNKGILVIEKLAEKLSQTKSERYATKLGLRIQDLVKNDAGNNAGLHQFSWGVIGHHLDQIVGVD